MTDAPPDVLVLGGGPAGCAAASLLARWGHQVLLLTRPSSGPPLGESIPPSTQKLFELLEVSDAIDAAGFVRSTGNTVWWGSGAPRVEYFDGGRRGWQVTTHALESVLREMAVRAGARVEDLAASSNGTPVPPGGALNDRGARFTLDCTGRAGLLARSRGLRVYADAPRIVALAALWRADRAFDLPDSTHTVIESYEGGWAWSVPDPSEARFVAVMVDPKTSDLARDTSAYEVYAREIGKTRRMRALLDDAARLSRVAGWDATMYDAVRYVDDRVLLVGDAASFIDPLSSAGVKKALASGWLAAVAVHTALARPAMSTIALDFFAAREAEVFAAMRAATRRTLADAAAGHLHPFWRDREADAMPAKEQDEIAAALHHLRAQPELRVMMHPAAAIDHRPVVRGNEVVLEPHLVRHDQPAAVRYACDTDLLALVQLAPAYTSVPALFEAYNARQPPVELPRFLGALAAALAQKWLVWL